MGGRLSSLGRRAAVALAFLPLLMLPARAQSDEAAVAARLRDAALKDDWGYRFLESETTLIGQRLAATEAEARAADWAEKTLKGAGFENVHREPVPMTAWIRGREEASVIAPAPQRLVVTALGGSVATPAAGIDAEIVLFREYSQLLAAPPGSLSGKIAVVTERMPRVMDGASYGAANPIRRAGPSEAARRGAVAYLHRSLGTDNHRIAHTGITDYTADAPPIPAAALSVPDAQQLDRLVAKGGPVRIRLLLTPRDLGPATSANVVGELKGRSKPDEVVLLGAHLDSWDQGTGAVDDGAGVTIVTAAAKLIHDLPQRPRRTIRVVLYGSEEPGIFGGKAYAEAHKADLNRIVIVAEPDSGQGPITRFSTGVADPNESSIKRIRDALNLLGIPAGNNMSRGSSDVEPLAEMHVPAVTLGMDGSDYFDLHHTPDDTLDKIEPKRINQSTAAYAVFTYLAAELDGNYRPAATTSAITK